MKFIPLIRASAVLPFVKFLNHIGAPTERYLKQVHLPIVNPENSENLVPLIQTLAFGELVARKEGIENLGMVVAQKSQLSELGNYGGLLCQSLTLYEMLCKIVKLRSMLNSGAKVWLTEDSNYFWLKHQFTIPHHIQADQGQGFALTMYLNVIRLAAGSNWQPDRLYLQGSKSKNKFFLELDCLSNTQIYFHQSHNAFRFSKNLLSKPLIRSTIPFIYSDAEENLKLTAPSANLTDSLRQLILLLLPEGHPSLPIAAEASGTSIRTFQRQLEKSNLNYSQLVEQIRFDQAVNLLKDPTNKLIDIAFDLGYTDAANFTRAFKRWTGVSPSQFRNFHLQC
ncbi:helix-turn-helix domain-containing protein [Aerosakkonemataceae cyanobacterium BLCC-F50]|uniref:Helix-turn-helix domain-containing protein n=1 Tax=Floridaenema flaviceps BLCC-F50 TaxID=3153642 RepID=A0ABV4XN65_9CYAN